MALSQSEIRSNARLISLIRLLLIAIALAVLTFFLAGSEESQEVWHKALDLTQYLLGAVACMALLLVLCVPLVTRVWQLVLHLVFDLLWLGGVVFLSGGVGGPAVPLLFAVILTSNLVLPGAAPFVMPSLAGLVLAAVGGLYLGGSTPFDPGALPQGHALLDPPRILGTLAVQIGAMFAVDILGQSLSRRLTEQRVLLADLIEQLGEGVVAVDRRGLVLYRNETAVELLEATAPIDPGVSLVAQLRASGSPLIADLVERPQLPVLERVTTTGGRVLTVRVVYLRGRGGRIIGRNLMIADETRLHDLEADSVRAEGLAAMGRMAAGIAHEVRNPLASLRGCAQELGSMARAGGQEDAESLSAIVVKEADRLERIVGEFLSLSRQRPPQQMGVDVIPIIDEISDMVRRRPHIPQRLVIRSNIAKDVPPLWVDPDQFRQVLINLMVNAAESFIGSDRLSPEMVISAEHDEREVHLSIADNGCGIDAERLAQIFTPFHSSKSQGTGLGLPLVDRIIREHGGRIRVTSHVGEGTQVRVSLPVADVSRLHGGGQIHAAER